MKDKSYWKIEGWDGETLLFERYLLRGQITEKSMKLLLPALVAKMSLNYDEIINSYAKRGTKIYNSHLEVRYSNGNQYMLTCGDTPCANAIIVKDHDVK